MKSLIACTIMLFTLSAGAQNGHRYAEPTMSTPRNVDGRSIAAMLSARQFQGRAKTEVSHDGGDSVFIFPIVGNTPGAGGTFFRSEGTLTNNNTQRSQTLRMFFFPASQSSCNGSIRDLTLAANTWYTYADLVAQVFGANGLGSMVVFAINSSGNVDSSASVDAVLRIWTPSPFGGSASQTFESVGASTFGGRQGIIGLRQDNGFRTNYGIFNYQTFTRSFAVYFTGTSAETSTTVNVGPCSVAFQSVPAANYGALVIDIFPNDGQGLWYGFASSVDNISQDNWSVSARP